MIAAGDPAAAPYLSEPRDRYRGQAAAILKPGSTREVAAIVRACADRRLGIVPHAGGTGLVGGQVTEAAPAPVVLSLERMNRVREVLPRDGVVVAEAGVVLADLQACAAGAGRLLPLSLASEGSARLGGLLATNAGGVAVLRYGNARDLCLGVEAVLPDGSVLHGLKPLRKDNTGYDLRHLLIGSEGTLGIITAAVMKLYPAPAERVTAMLTVPSPAAAVDLLDALRTALGDQVTAFELIARQGMDWLARFHPERADPLPGRPAWRVLVEATAPGGTGLDARAEAAFAAAFEAGLATDGALAQSEAQRAAIWWLRETIPEANRRVGALSSHDIAVPVSRIPAFIEAATAAVGAVDADLRVNCFGHVGDGNLHFNVFPPEGRRKADVAGLEPAVMRAVHDRVAACGGTISAEHGIGRAKPAELRRYGDPAKLAAMRAIKAALDPLGIMNPGAIFG
ncbi:MAG TPA: FAD-binding oxidoreductase [Thermohalobaculum sp.]|nr:FAD-binding oxidoreductase [Thermohalobaculum sp.]